MTGTDGVRKKDEFNELLLILSYTTEISRLTESRIRDFIVESTF